MTHYDNAKNTAKTLNGKLITFVREPHETTLYVAIVEREHEFVTWNYNAEFDGFSNGYYTTTYENAFQKLMQRLK